MSTGTFKFERALHPNNSAGHLAEALMPATPQFATLRARRGLALPNHTISTTGGREKFGASTRWRLEAQRRCFFSGHLPGEVTLDARVLQYRYYPAE